MWVVAICGRAGAGKTTLAGELERAAAAAGRTVARVSFGAAVKKHVAEIFGVAHKDRELLQRFAEAVRAIDEDAWARLARRQVETERGRADLVVVDDLRYPGELAALRATGARLLVARRRLSRETQRARLAALYGAGAAAPRLLEHPSEQHADSLPADLEFDEDADAAGAAALILRVIATADAPASAAPAL